MNRAVETRIKAYIMTHGSKNADTNEDFEKWKIKKDDLFNILPVYFENDLFSKLFFDIPEDMLLYYFDNFSLPDIKEHLIALGNEVIKDNCL